MVSDWFKKAILNGLNPHCPLCGLSLGDQHAFGICHACQTWYPNKPRCLSCGLPTLVKVDQCGQCLTKPPLWQRLYCVGDYQFPLSNTVHQLKYQRQFWQAKPLARRLAECIETPAPLITSVPLHWKRQLYRGFNQSDLIARYLSQQIKSQYQADLFSRVIATKTQQSLSKKQRQKNLARAFRLNRKPSTTHVGIVDDVVTTGSTIQHLCHLLLAVGIERIDIYCICRTPEPEDHH